MQDEPAANIGNPQACFEASRETALRLLESIPEGFVALDREWRFTYLNREAERILAERPRAREPLLGRSLWEALPQLAGTPLEREFRRAVAEQSPAVFEHFSPAVDAWFEVRAFPAPEGLSIYFRDVTDRKQAERLQEIQHEVTRVLAESPTLADAYSQILRSVCSRLGWQVGALWRVDPEAAAVRCLEVWRDEEALAPFEEASRRLRLGPGIGLPGRVWDSAAPAWVPDVVRDDNFPRASIAEEVGLHGAFGFPIRSERRVIGVMEFFSQEIQRPDPGLLHLLATVGSQIGQLIERREADEGVRQSEALKAAILEAALDAVITMGHDGRIVEWNPAAERIFGYRRADAVGSVMGDLIVPPALRERHRQGLARYLATGQASVLGRRLELAAIRADGREFPIELAIGRIPTEGPPVFTAYVRDITERVRGEQELQAQRQALEAINAELQAANDALKRAEEGTRYLMQHARCLLWHATIEAPPIPGQAYHWNLQFFDEQGARRFLPLEMQPGESYAQAFHRHRPPEDRRMVDQNARAALEAGHSHYRQEYRCERLDGSVRWLSEETHLEPLGPGRWRAVGVCTDITEYKELEEALRRQSEELREMDRQKDRFLAVLGHELRNPLGIMANTLHLLRRRVRDDPAALDCCPVLERQLRQVARIVGDLQDASRIKLGRLDLQKQEVDLVACLHQVVEAARPAIEERLHCLSVTLPAGPMMIEGDPDRLTQVFTNLLHNAIKYTEPGGEIGLTAARNGKTAMVSLRDSGVGIEAAALPSIFDMFMQADWNGPRARGGLGIGLGLVRALVEMHGGTVTAASAGAGQGSEFVVHLPLPGS